MTEDNFAKEREAVKKRAKKVFYGLNRLNQKINCMSHDELVEHLEVNKLSVVGHDDVLKARLKYFFKVQRFTEAGLGYIIFSLPFYIVVDFEATCDTLNPPDFPHEIIEFPAVLISSRQLKIIDRFQHYVNPEINHKLSNFCKTLTGITQKQVDDAESFPVVLQKFKQWISSHELGKEGREFAIVTDGPWDMGRFLYGQCMISQVPYPPFAEKWINMRKIFRTFYSQQQVSLQGMLDLVGLDFVGRPHCGLDDAVNIARIFIQMIKDGATVKYNETIRPNKSPSSNLYVQNYLGNEWERKYKESDRYMYREQSGLLYLLDKKKRKKSRKPKGKSAENTS